MDYKVDEILQITSGEYSNKSTHTIARVKIAFDKDAMIAAFKLTITDDDDPYDVQGWFVSWLVQQGVIEEIDYTVMHIGSYSTLE